MDKGVKVFVAVYDDVSLLRHFLRHYRAQGAGRFFVAVSRAAAKEARRRARGFPVVFVDSLNVAESFVGGAAAVTAMRLRYSDPGEWVAIADLYEFQVHPRGMAASIRLAEREGANVVRGTMIDRVAADGGFPAIHPRSDLSKLFPVRCRLTKRLQRGIDHKCVLVRGLLLPAMAHHRMAGEKVGSRAIEIHHFKWSASAVPRMRKAIKRIKASGLRPYHVEYERVLGHLREHGRIRWEEFVA